MSTVTKSTDPIEVSEYQFQNRPPEQNYAGESVYSPYQFSACKNEVLYTIPHFYEDPSLMDKYLTFINRIYITKRYVKRFNRLMKVGKIWIDSHLDPNNHYHINPMVEFSSFCKLVKMHLIDTGVYTVSLDKNNGISYYGMITQITLEVMFHEAYPEFSNRYPEFKPLIKPKNK